MLVMCNGMIRAGSTLQYNLTRSLVEGVGVGVGEGFFSPAEYSKRDQQLRRWACDEALHVIKGHEIHPQAAEMVTSGSMVVLYIYRDIRDVAVSAKIKWRCRGRRLIRLLDKAVADYYRAKALDRSLFQKYEEVIDHTPSALTGIASFLGIELRSKLSENIVRECSLESAMHVARHIERRPSIRMRVWLKRIGIGTDPYDDVTLLHPDHISEHGGASGVWRRVLTSGEKKELSARYKAWLTETGYMGSL